MKILGNIIWLIFGGLEAAIGYFTGSVALMITIMAYRWVYRRSNWAFCAYGHSARR